LSVGEARRLAEEHAPAERAGCGHSPASPAGPAEPLLAVSGLTYDYGRQRVLDGVDLTVAPGELVALMGRNGSGKTTLLRTLVGLLRPASGEVQIEGRPIRGQSTAEICRRVGYLPQQPDDLLFAETVCQEVEATLGYHRLLASPPIAPDDLLGRLGLSGQAEAYPRDLSVGQRQRVALAAVTVTRPPLLLLDEPTRGMDYRAKEDLQALLCGWRSEGTGILLVTHDVELVAQAADRVLILDAGRIVADGAPAEVLSGEEVFSPQVAQVFPGCGWLTVEDALAALRAPESTSTP